MPAIDSVAEVTSLLEKWDREESGLSPQDNVPLLTRLSELVEKETEAWYKMDPDPFDDRHPGRADPNCALGHLLKALFKNDNFMSKLVSVYLMSNRDLTELQTQACRLLLDVMPGLEATVVFQENDNIVRRLFQWAESAQEPLRSYATGLVAGAMEVQDIAANFREINSTMVPMMLKRLYEIQKEEKNSQIFERPFANIGRDFTGSSKATAKSPVAKCVPNAKSEESPGLISLDSKKKKDGEKDGEMKDGEKNGEVANKEAENLMLSPAKMGGGATSSEKPRISGQFSPGAWMSPAAHRDGTGSLSGYSPTFRRRPSLADCSNSSWKELEPYVIGNYCMYPLGPNMQQRLILQYLTPMGEYQELLSYVFEQDAMQLIFNYINLSKNRDVRLAFEALKYLAALLCHKKFALEFIAAGGVERLLQVYRPSVAATGVSTCLYYLAYFEDAMERVCMLPQHVLNELIVYMLWLLECSHESGRCHAIMFFSMAFPIRIIIELFDSHDGLRKLYNVISTQEILSIEESNAFLTDDRIFTSRQATRHVCVALRKYMEVHLALKANQIRRAHMRNEGGPPVLELPAYKALKMSADAIQADVELLLEFMPSRIRWDPVTQIHQLGGITLLLQLVAMAAEWNAYTGKAETIRSALDVLAVCAVLPKTQLQLCETVALPDNITTPTMSILLGLAEGEVLLDPDVQKAALGLIINCVCAPMNRYSGAVGRFVGGSAKKTIRMKTGEDLLQKIWHEIRSNNGIMVLLKLLITKTPITEADAIRALACKALVGLIRCDTVKQIISKLPLISDGQLQQLMKEPVLQDMRQAHVKFCKQANEIIQQVSGKTQTAGIDASFDRIRRAELVAQTKIVYQEKELLQLIHEHLKSKGLSDTAAALQREAGLPRTNSPPPLHPASPHIYSSPSTPKMSRALSSPGGSIKANSSSATSTPVSTPQAPIRFNLQNAKQCTQSPSTSGQPKSARRFARQKHEPNFTAPLLKHQPHKTETTASLDKIVTEYLRKQHATCKNLVVTCPPFSLLSPHRCPDPRNRSSAPLNITARLHQRMLHPPYGGPDGQRCNRKYIYSKFRPIRSYRDPAEDSYSCCAFSSCEQYLMIGTYTGELKVFNIQTGEDTLFYDCHSTPVSHVQPSKDGRLVLTTGSWDTPLSALWSSTDVFEIQKTFPSDNYVEFSKHTQDRIIGTEKEKSKMYDVATGQVIQKFHDPDKANNYLRNRATFNTTDDLVLNDGVLWDVNSGKSVHKFDKFNPNISGIFHPMGLEIIINSEVWDLRTFHLLHTVPALDQCDIRFNHRGDVIYGAIRQNDEDDILNEEAINKSPFGSSFRTFDATDYSQIATIDVKKSIMDLCTDSSDCYLAVIENQKTPETLAEESICRLYEVGRTRDDEDDQGDDDDDDDEDEDMDDDDDDDDDDNDDDGDGDGSNLENDDDNESEHYNNSDRSNSESDLDSSDSVGDDDDDDDLDNMFFELSDLSQF